MRHNADSKVVRFYEVLLDHPCWAISLVLLLTVLAASQLRKTRIVSDLKSLLPQDRVRQEDERIKSTFGIRDSIVVAVSRKPTAFTNETLRYLESLAGEIGRLDGVHRVRSVLTEDNISREGDTVRIEPFVNRASQDTAASAAKGIRAFPGVQGVLASADLETISLLVEVEDHADKSSVYYALKDVLALNQPPSGVSCHVSGVPVFEGVLGDYILRDLLVMVPIVSAVVIVLLYIGYRSWLLVFLALVEFAVVNTWTLGLMAYCGVPLYIIHSTMPVILIALGVADEIHIFGRYIEECQEGNGTLREKILTTMREMWPPVVLTSLTTALGLLSFLTSSMRPLRYFGLFTAVGVIAAMVFSLTVTPVAILLAHAGRREQRRDSRVARQLQGLGRWLLVKRHLVRAFLVFVALASLVGGLFVYVQDSWIANFAQTSEVRRSNRAICHALNGTRLIQVELDASANGGIEEPALLLKVARFQEQLCKEDGVGGTFSLVDIIKKMNLEFAGSFSLPGTRAAIAQYMMLIDGRSYDSLWDFDHRRMRVVVFCKKGDYQTGCSVFPRIDKQLEELQLNAQSTVGGDYALSYHWGESIGRDQLKSLCTAVLLVFSMGSLLFRSFWKCLRVATPVLLAVGMNFGAMGLCNIPLGVATSMFSAITMGIGVDYAIHLQSRLDLERERHGLDRAVPDVFATAGRAILCDGGVIVAGFLTLLSSAIPPVRSLGLIVSLGVSTSLVAAFLVVPASCSGRQGPRSLRGSSEAVVAGPRPGRPGS